uniref:HAP1 N-terminal domain-containing protein n=1 Tax=Steinernema glaseri TaxID=37863 RepID=A0A1I8AI97_9BILA
MKGVDRAMYEETIEDLRDTVFLLRLKFSEAEQRACALEAENQDLRSHLLRSQEHARDRIALLDETLEERLKENEVHREELEDLVDLFKLKYSCQEQIVKNLVDENRCLLDAFNGLVEELRQQQVELKGAKDRIEYQERERIWLEAENEFLLGCQGKSAPCDALEPIKEEDEEQGIPKSASCGALEPIKEEDEEESEMDSGTATEPQRPHDRRSALCLIA